MAEKMLKCPNCGYTFKEPFMDRKILGFGWTFPGMGVIVCPKCNYTAPRNEFIKIS